MHACMSLDYQGCGFRRGTHLAFVSQRDGVHAPCGHLRHSDALQAAAWRSACKPGSACCCVFGPADARELIAGSGPSSKRSKALHLQAGLRRHHIVARPLLVWLPCRLLILVAAKRPGLCKHDRACVSIMLCTSVLASFAAHRPQGMLALELAGVGTRATHLACVIQRQSVPAAQRSLSRTRKNWNAMLLNA
jgi:hypothetical protein